MKMQGSPTLSFLNKILRKVSDAEGGVLEPFERGGMDAMEGPSPVLRIRNPPLCVRVWQRKMLLMMPDRVGPQRGPARLRAEKNCWWEYKVEAFHLRYCKDMDGSAPLEFQSLWS